eukprot:TRINITY_DN109822_c0_g1_i1.p1 TRINITY_DN109822_c0_g1~~TRINITY_DN109822_c0_g1_i1.p1  ORF type:complete len:404 (+),score=101.58 TRINITY_DN109822_c0_g1_i1:137-1348(+)
MMRPPSREDVQTAQSHLVLLKSKMRQRRSHQAPLCSADSLPERHARRFERVGARAASASNGGVPAEAFPQQQQHSRGVTWDPPSAAMHAQQQPQQSSSLPLRSPGRSAAAEVPAARQRPQFDESSGYPSSPSQVRDPFGQQRQQPLTPAGGGGIPNSMDAGMLDDGGPLVPCPDCGRKFKEESLEKHTKICKKVFQQKRKQFNSAANRLGEFENANELIAKASQIEKEKEVPKKEAKPGKVPKWKAESLAFRQAILAAKGAGGDEEAQQKANELQQQLGAIKEAAGDEVDPDMLKCPHCGRTFNKEAGERHVKICQKTFGGKPGGGRLVKGSGTAAKAAAQPTTGGVGKPNSPADLAAASRGGGGPPASSAQGRGPSMGAGNAAIGRKSSARRISTGAQASKR